MKASKSARLPYDSISCVSDYVWMVRMEARSKTSPVTAFFWAKNTNGLANSPLCLRCWQMS